MPQYEMDKSGEVEGKTFDDLSPFVQGYLEAAFFTNENTGVSMVEYDDPEVQEDIREGRSDGEVPADADFGDIYPGSLATAIRECEDFQREAADLLAEAYGQTFPARVIGDGSLPDSHRPAWDYDEAAAGRDFWFTRNGHGVGYWDRDLPGELGDKLTEVAEKFGGRDMSFGQAADGSESPTGYGWVFIE
jgi:hypothetical protein